MYPPPPQSQRALSPVIRYLFDCTSPPYHPTSTRSLVVYFALSLMALSVFHALSDRDFSFLLVRGGRAGEGESEEGGGTPALSASPNHQPPYHTLTRTHQDGAGVVGVGVGVTQR